ncbi:PREDICTED: zinc transporter ZIP13 homolog [Dufourea novaeangliae]|uniref:zinc transporter ZIP13 homolog n=1 Tax=Dufourea novaeangliae TaxID=178035 RepID=UPI00076714C0|nr:PREDICTED: zinc transporter ZIP13 homolog [Dufourea novaeangliae]XP_015432886.1 PREDICTED: zinc transporter ZIP13 homolog [Dufourea novaeangliae]
MAANMSIESSGFLYDMVTEDLWGSWESALDYFEYTPWVFSLLGSTMIGLTGIFPLFIIHIDEAAALKTGGDSAGTLKILLSFAVGGLLGDVFLHLLPEAWGNSTFQTAKDAGHPSIACGLWVLSGFLIFVIAEKLFNFEQETEIDDESVMSKKEEPRCNGGIQAEKEMENNNCITLINGDPKNEISKRYAKTDYQKSIDEIQPFLENKNGYSHLQNGYKNSHKKNGFVGNGIKPVLMCNEFSNTLGGLSIDEAKNCLKKLTQINGFSSERSKGGCSEEKKLLVADAVSIKKTVKKEKSKHITGYLNLMANIIDNFTHGLAVGGSFLVSLRLGMLTTFAILIHEIPHEVGDFAILLRSGFTRWDAARAQLITASGGIFGAMSAVFFSGGEVGVKTSWILPFTAGGFLHIGMVTILPELLKESNPKESLKQLAALLLGIVLMAVLTILCD